MKQTRRPGKTKYVLNRSAAGKAGLELTHICQHGIGNLSEILSIDYQHLYQTKFAGMDKLGLKTQGNNKTVCVQKLQLTLNRFIVDMCEDPE